MQYEYAQAPDFWCISQLPQCHSCPWPAHVIQKFSSQLGAADGEGCLTKAMGGRAAIRLPGDRTLLSTRGEALDELLWGSTNFG